MQAELGNPTANCFFTQILHFIALSQVQTAKKLLSLASSNIYVSCWCPGALGARPEHQNLTRQWKLTWEGRMPRMAPSHREKMHSAGAWIPCFPQYCININKSKSNEVANEKPKHPLTPRTQRGNKWKDSKPLSKDT